MTWPLYLYMPHRSQRTCLEFREEEPEKSPEYSGTHYMVEEKHSVLEKLTVWYPNPTLNTKSVTGHDLETLPIPLILTIHLTDSQLNPYPTAFPYGNGMVLHFYQQQESSTTKTVHKVINKGLKTYV